MIVSSSSASLLTKQMQANGLSDAAVKQVNGDLAAAVKQVTAASGGGTVDAASVRAALDQRISADVSSGKLSADDAAKVTKSLDDIDSQSSGSGITSQTAPAAGAAQASSGASAGAAQEGGGGGGGGGSASKTEMSRTVTISGSTETTIVTYTDGTSETTTSVASDADKIKYGKPSATDASATGDTAAQDYLSTIEPGSLIDKQA